MTSTELDVLKIIWKNKGKASISEIASELRISPDYGRLICQCLVRDKIIEFFEGQYNITNLGRKKLKKLGLLEKEKTRPKPKALRQLRQTTKLLAGKRKKTSKTPIIRLSDLSSDLKKALEKKGIRTLEDIATAGISELMEIEELNLYRAASMINEARYKLKKQGKEYLWDHNYHGS